MYLCVSRKVVSWSKHFDIRNYIMHLSLSLYIIIYIYIYIHTYIQIKNIYWLIKKQQQILQ